MWGYIFDYVDLNIMRKGKGEKLVWIHSRMNKNPNKLREGV